MITYDLNLCIGEENPGKKLTVKCHDTGVNLRVHLMVCKHGKWRNEYERYTIPVGSTAVLKITKPDGKYCITDGDAGSTEILFEMVPQAFSVAGICKAEVSLFGPDGKRITSSTFYIDVPEECICGCDLESEDYIDVMSEQIRAAIDAANRAEEAAVHSPIIQDGTWWLWNPGTMQYEDSGCKAVPEDGGGGEAFYVSLTGTDKYYTKDKSMDEISNAYDERKSLYCKLMLDGFPIVLPLSAYSATSDATMAVFSNAIDIGNYDKNYSVVVVSMLNDKVIVKRTRIIKPGDELPNPYALTFSGAVDAVYNGSEPLTVEIPEGGTKPLAGTTEEITPQNVADAVKNGTPVVITHDGTTFDSFAVLGDLRAVVASVVANTGTQTHLMSCIGNLVSGQWFSTTAEIPTTTDLPKAFYFAVTPSEEDAATASATYAEVKTAADRGSPIIAIVDGLESAVMAWDGTHFVGDSRTYKVMFNRTGCYTMKYPDYMGKPDTAKVGQAVVVDTVDENNAPLTFKTVDFPSGGGGGGNVHFESQDFTLPEDADGFDFQLPVPVKNLIMYNLIIVRPTYAPSVDKCMLYAMHGNNNIAFGNTTPTGSTNFTGFRYGEYIGVTISTRHQDNYYEHTIPSIGAAGKTPLGNGDKISIINMTDGVVFPAGTRIMFWGVYFQ